nr:hypothetical protein [Tanacetum cinerariifolium]
MHAKVDGKAVVISESLVRSDPLFDDEDGFNFWLQALVCLILRAWIKEMLGVYRLYILDTWNGVHKWSSDENSSKTVNSVKKIHAKVDGKAVVISESLVRSDPLFDDEDGNVTPLFDTMLVKHQAPKGEGSAIPPEPQPTPSTSQNLHHEKERPKHVGEPKKAAELPQTSVLLNLGAYEVVNQEKGDRVERAITTDASLEATQDSDNIIKTQTTTMPNVDTPQGIDTGGSPRRQETIRGTSAQTRSERVLKKPNEPPFPEGHTSRSREDRLEENIELTDTVHTPYDLPLTGGYTPRSDKGRITLAELIETCITLSNRVTQLENELSTTKLSTTRPLSL